MIPPYLIGATPPPPDDGWGAWAEDDIPATALLDRVFPPEQSDPGWGDLYVATLHPDRRMAS